MSVSQSVLILQLELLNQSSNPVSTLFGSTSWNTDFCRLNNLLASCKKWLENRQPLNDRSPAASEHFMSAEYLNGALGC